jgi:hypothetical protein
MTRHLREVDTVKQLDKEMADWRSKREQFATELQAAEVACTAATTARESVLVAARAENNQTAQAVLEEHTAALGKAEQEVKDLTTLLAQIDAKLAELARQHKAAQREAAVVQLREMAEQRLTVGATIERLVTELVPELGQWVRVSNDMSVLADEWQFPNAAVYARRYTLAAFIGWRLRPFALNLSLMPETRGAGLLETDREALETLLRRLEGPDRADKKAA